MKRALRWTALAALVAFAAIQLVPVDRSNPPVEDEVPAPAEVRAVLRRACYDCHSNETTWPWYSRIAPVSWLLAADVREGRKELNYSTWSRYDAKRQAKLLKESWEEVAEGEMPPSLYGPLHPDATLGEQDRAALKAWATAQP